MMALSDPHMYELETGSAIARDVIAERGYETVGKKEVPDAFTTAQRGSGLLVPLHNVHGNQAGYQLKRDEPRVDKRRGRTIKYETPGGAHVLLDVHPRCRQHLSDPYVPLWITEGAKKADSAISAGVPCVIDVSGVYNWRGSNADDGLTALGDWEVIALKSSDGTPRDVLLAFDSDISSNANVQKAVKRLQRFLKSKGANARVLVMPDLENGSKCGLDDWFVSGGTIEGLRELVLDDIPAQPIDRGEEAPFSDDTYRANAQGFWRVSTKDGEEVFNRLTDFTAWIVTQTVHPERPDLNYAEVMLRDVRGRLNGPMRVLDSAFRQVDGRSGWLGMFGSSHRVYAGVSNAHLVNAIQVASGDVPVVTVYDRLGWMQSSGGDWGYLTSTGAMGADGLDTTIRVEPGGRLHEYQLQATDDIEAVREAVRRVLEIPLIAITDQGAAAVQVTLASMLRSLLIPARRQNFTTTIVGETGSGKSAVAGLVLQMFGPTFGYDHLTDNWGSTLNSLLDNASRARHAPLVVDDYVEIDTGGAGIGRQAHSRDTLVRLVANSAPRNRLKSDATRNDGAEPETGLISTQETVGSFRHASEAARQVFVRLEKRGDDGADISIDRVKQYSREYGRTGVYNLALSGYVRALADDMGTLQKRIDTMHDGAMDALSQRLHGLTLHERTLPALADLALGWDVFIAFAKQCGAISSTDAEAQREACMMALIRIAEDQASEQGAERPEIVILELLQELFSSRKASLRNRSTDDVPENAVAMGWKVREGKDYGDRDYIPAQHEIGWVDSEFVYLSPSATAQALQGIATASRLTLPAGERQIGACLVRGNVAEPGDGGKSTRSIDVGETSEAMTARRVRAIRIPRLRVFPEVVKLTDPERPELRNVTDLSGRRSA